jgi:hypothetical protein
VYTSGAVFWISVTGVLAFCVNLSIYLVCSAFCLFVVCVTVWLMCALEWNGTERQVIGNTSPISYNVLGHFKLCVILFSGWLFFAEDMNDKKTLGIAHALWLRLTCAQGSAALISYVFCLLFAV